MSDRLYYADPSLASFEAHVTDIREVSRNQGRSLWQIALDRSAFYPTSGGQPHDTGMLTATSSGGAVLEAPILAVEEDEQGEVWHTTPKPLLAGTAVRGYVDWSRRRDHMQQHSGQHLLSALVHRQLGAATVSFHLGEMTSTIDLVREAISPEELERVEDAANEIIAEDRAVTMRTIPRAEAEMLLAAGTLHKLPEREGDIRLIEIDEVDLNACGGTHVRSTGQIGGLLIRGTERMRQGIRVEFVCGMRAAVTARRDLATLTRAATALSVGRLEVAEAVERLLAEGKAAHKARQKLTEEMAGYHASMLLLEYPWGRAAECCAKPSPIMTPTISSCWRRGWWPRLEEPACCWPPPRRNRPGWSWRQALMQKSIAVPCCARRLRFMVYGEADPLEWRRARFPLLIWTRSSAASKAVSHHINWQNALNSMLVVPIFVGL